MPEQQVSQAVAQGWEVEPVGRQRLAGVESDPEDNCLKELMIASALLEQSKSSAGNCPGGIAQLQVVYPLLVGRQQPAGHRDYPCMGNFFQILGGGGYFIDQPSPTTARNVSSFLQIRQDLLQRLLLW